MRALTPLLALFAIPVFAGPLNDTGATQCYNGSVLVACDAANTGDGATHPRQDGRFGRDAQATASQLSKTGGGAAGFDFTPLDASGNAIAIVGGVPASPPACTRDNVTGLIWEVKTDDNGLRDKDWIYHWGDTTGGAGCGGTLTPCHTDNLINAVNTAGLCGHTSGWRLPTRRELLSIVHHGTWSPSIDTDYFPNTVSSWYWSSDLYAPDPAVAWLVYFNDGGADTYFHDGNLHVRLVRSGQ